MIHVELLAELSVKANLYFGCGVVRGQGLLPGSALIQLPAGRADS